MYNREELIEIIREIAPDAVFPEGTQLLEVIVPIEKYFGTAQKLKLDARLKFDYLVSHTAVDNNTYFTIVNHIESTSLRNLIVLKTKTPDHENSSVDSLTALYPAAEFFEREVFDLFGIHYTNHPNLKRFYLEEGYGHPLRKDFRDEINFIER